MRRAIFITIMSSAISVPAFAAETGTYRPGQAYFSTPVNAPDQCAAQCQGDAQCKGWNFVRPRQYSPAGVCELNAFQAAPVPSSISISGDNSNVRSSPRITPAGTNTIRVGIPAAKQRVRAAPQGEQQVMRAPASRPAPRTNARPKSAKAQLNYQLDSAPAVRSIQPPRRSHAVTESLKAPVQRSTQRQAPAETTAVKTNMPHFRYNLDGAQPSNPAMAARPRSPAEKRLAQLTLASTPAQIQPAASTAAPRSSITPPQPAALPQSNMGPPPAAPRTLPGSVSHQSLFGSLHDDVSVTVPLPLTPQAIASDPDAPIATVTSVRTKPVETRALGQLAGAP